MDEWINQYIVLCYHLQPSLYALATTQSALPPTPSLSEASAISPLPSATLFSTTGTKQPLLLLLLLLPLLLPLLYLFLLLLPQHQRVSPGYLSPTPIRTALPNTSTSKIMMHMTAMFKTICEQNSCFGDFSHFLWFLPYFTFLTLINNRYNITLTKPHFLALSGFIWDRNEGQYLYAT